MNDATAAMIFYVVCPLLLYAWTRMKGDDDES